MRVFDYHIFEVFLCSCQDFVCHGSSKYATASRPSCSAPNTPRPQCCTASVHTDGCFGAADNPQPDDLIQSAIYSRDWDSDPHMGRGRPGHAPSEGQGHQGMDIDSAAAHRIPRGRLGMYHCPTDPPSTHMLTACSTHAHSMQSHTTGRRGQGKCGVIRFGLTTNRTLCQVRQLVIPSLAGDDSAAESDASSVSDYDATSDPMDRFSVTALPATALPGTALLAPHPQGLQPGPSSTWHQSQEQLAHASDDSAHDPRNLGARLGSSMEEEEAAGPAARPDLAALRGRDDSARDMPVLLHMFTFIVCIICAAVEVLLETSACHEFTEL